MNKFKHDILLRIVKSINIILITIPFAVCWFFYYADHVVSPFYSKGNWLVILLFLVFYITFGRIYDAFLISIYSVAEIMYSQILSAMLSDGVMYVIICLLSKGFPNLLPGILAIAGQLLLSVLCRSRGVTLLFEGELACDFAFPCFLHHFWTHI